MAIINGVGRVGIRVTSGSSPAPSYLLDTYSGASGAYSLRKLSSTYSGSAIRVRRSSDNTEQNIGFDGSGNLDTTALTSFVGAGNGFITTWYDQSGNGYNLTQTTAASQPKIVNSGTVLLSNTKPIIQTDGNSFLYNANIPINGTTNSIFFGLKITSSKFTCAMMSGGGDINQHFPMRTGTGADRLYDSVSNITAAALPTGLNLINLHENSSGITIYENNTLLTSNYTHNTPNSTGLYLFRREAGNGLLDGYGINEVIIYGSGSKLSDNSAISTNINTYYSIY
jgi:hypothetical protein